MLQRQGHVMLDQHTLVLPELHMCHVVATGSWQSMLCYLDAS